MPFSYFAAKHFANAKRSYYGWVNMVKSSKCKQSVWLLTCHFGSFWNSVWLLLVKKIWQPCVCRGSSENCNVTWCTCLLPTNNVGINIFRLLLIVLALIDNGKFISVYCYTWKLSCSLNLSSRTCFVIALQLWLRNIAF